ncbi:HD-GYP domain-containing protein [Evansella vedderi]|nr:HD-GYP domain-containing protein [Evansella vedderi]
MNQDHKIIGRVLADDVISDLGHFLLRRGMVLSPWHLQILKIHKIEYVVLQDMEAPPLNIQIKNVFKNNEEVSNLYYENVMEIKSLFQQAISREIPSLQTFMKPFTPLLETVIKGSNILLELHHIRGYDEYTYRHSINVGLLAATIGKILKYPNEITMILGKVGFLHDIGKMKVSHQILNKKGPLTDQEYGEIKKHTIYGKEILESIEGTEQALKIGALYHHERLDGSGYPHNLRGKEIPFLAQIIAVADTYDAVSSDRVYRNKYAPLEALNELVKDVYNGRLNGEIVLPFVNHIMNGYMGNKVVLSDGRRGQIVHLHIDEIYRPLVMLDDGQCIDLRKHRTIAIVNVFS